MPAIVVKLPDEPIVVLTATDPFVPQEDLPAAYEEIAEVIDGIPGLVYCLYDISSVYLGFSDLVATLGIAIRGLPGSASDPRVKVVIVGSDDLAQLASEASHQEQYHHLNFPLFAVMEEAVDYARAELAEQIGG
jgi:hypothetical protein